LSRREVLALFGATGAAVLAAGASAQSNTAQARSAADPSDAGKVIYLPLVMKPAATATPTPTATAGPTLTPTPTATIGLTPTPTATTLPSCVVRPALTEGPYFVDEKLNRSDIRSDTNTGVVKQGVLLTLSFQISKVVTGGCSALSGVMVDVWHCDALGIYSDVDDPGFNTQGQNFLRGFQLTDSNGLATFTTIYPGWYSSRAVHIHFKLRTLSSSGSVTSEFTSQLFFNESITDLVHATSPYNTKGYRDTLNSEDNIYQNGGSQLLLSPAGNTASGYAATMDIGLNIV
jgi:protocatechuate 3,4-dioxygenase beta subunit